MAVEMLNDLMQALGLVLGSFAVTIGLAAAAWTGFDRARHPEWGAPAILLVLALTVAMRLIRGEFLSMAAVLLALAAPIIWAEGRRRGRRDRKGSGPDFRRPRLR